MNLETAEVGARVIEHIAEPVSHLLADLPEISGVNVGAAAASLEKTLKNLAADSPGSKLIEAALDSEHPHMITGARDFFRLSSDVRTSWGVSGMDHLTGLIRQGTHDSFSQAADTFGFLKEYAKTRDAGALAVSHPNELLARLLDSEAVVGTNTWTPWLPKLRSYG